MVDQQVRVRIAPSPTGDPHVGTAYVALFNYVFAKKNNGKFILRIEDTDRTRSSLQSDQQIISSLKWLGLDWDEGPNCGGEFGPYRQSERLSIYSKYVEQLLNNGSAYRCFCTAERLDKMRNEQKKQGLQTKYDRECLKLKPDEVKKHTSSGKSFVVRLKMPDEGETSFIDKIRGNISIANSQLDDQVILKTDGYPTYHLANVVDDYLMKITHVMRAEEWISSTPKHVCLYKAFGWKEPVWIHLSLLRNEDKSKISKRKNPVSLGYYKDAGILPQAMLNFLALMGWSFGDDQEIFSLEQMQNKFDLSQLGVSSPVFDLKKLDWLNQQYIQKMNQEEFISFIQQNLLSNNYLKEIYPLVRERFERFEDFLPKHLFFFCGSLDFDVMSVVPTNTDKKIFIQILENLLTALDELKTWELTSLTSTLDSIKAESGLKPKDFFMPLRLITTGRKDSPPLVETLVVLGRDRVRFRIRDFIKKIS